MPRFTRTEGSVHSLRFASILGVCLAAVVSASCTATTPSLRGNDELQLASDLSTEGLGSNILAAYEASQTHTTGSLLPLPRAQAIASVIDGEADAALLLFPPDDNMLFFTPIAQEMLIFVAPERAEYANVSDAVIRDLYRGNIAAWGAASDVPEIIAPLPDTSLSLALESAVLRGEQVGGHVLLAPSDDAIVAMIDNQPNSLGVVSFSTRRANLTTLSVDNSIPSLEETAYPYVVPVVFVAAEEPSGRLRQLLDWIVSEEGQDVVTRQMLGFAD